MEFKIPYLFGVLLGECLLEQSDNLSETLTLTAAKAHTTPHLPLPGHLGTETCLEFRVARNTSFKMQKLVVLIACVMHTNLKDILKSQHNWKEHLSCC